jgi:VWFA-related protein
LIDARLAAFLLLPWLFTVTFAQQGPAPSELDTGQIHLDVVVTPKAGPPVAGLQQQDFTVLDNKVPQTITSFQALSGVKAPVQVILLIDGVNTGYQTIAYERSQIDKFLRANGGQLAHPVKLAIFGDTGTQVQNNFTTDGNAIAESLDKQTVALRTIRRSQGFYGAVDRFDLSLKTLEQLSEVGAAHPGRTLVLWISPGWPLLSGPGVHMDDKQRQGIFNAIVMISTRLRQARLTLYDINPLGAAESTQNIFYYEEFLKGISKSSQVSDGNLALQVLATQTGGLVLNSSNDVTALLQQAFADADAWYELSFDPVRSEPNEYHHLEIRLDKPGLIPRTRQSYYTQP